MNRHRYLLFLTLLGSVFCWWPAALEPSIDFPRWILLALIVLMTALGVVLSGRHWFSFVMAASIGSFVGMCSAFVLFPSSDGIANSYAPIMIGVIGITVSVVSVLTGLAARRMYLSTRSARRLAWLLLAGCVASGPLAFALTSPLVARRVESNDRIAAQRFASVEAAVERTWVSETRPSSVCDGRILRRHYSGLPFTSEDWARITGNYVKEDGYMFMIYCGENGGYTIHALPARGRADGTRQFCTDESGRMSCGMEFNGSRNACTPCPRR